MAQQASRKKRKRLDAQPPAMSQSARKLDVALLGLPLEPGPRDAALLRAASAQVSHRLYVMLVGEWVSVPAPELERRIVAVLDMASEHHASLDVRPLLQGAAAAHGPFDIEAVLGTPLAKHQIGDLVLHQINAARRARTPQPLPEIPYRAICPDWYPLDAAANLGPPVPPNHATGAASPFPTYTDVCVGGTFDRLHNGHKVLLLVSALCTSKRLVVGVTGEPLLRKKTLKELLEPLSFRIAAVENFLRAVKPDIEYEVVGINDPYGPAITDAALRAIVVSSETRGGGNACNVKRRESTTPMDDLAVVEIGLVADTDADIDGSVDAKLSSSGQRARELACLRPVLPLEPDHEGRSTVDSAGGDEGSKSACAGRDALADPWHWIRRTPAGQPYCIGLTGGIASGKSTCAAFLRDELGARMIDCDKLGHRAYVKGTTAFEQIKKAFGESVVGADGEIDRTKLGPIVFGDPAQMQRLNQIVWPAIATLADEERAQLGAEGVKICIMEAAIMLEAGWAETVDEVWLVFAPRDTCIERLRARNGITQQQAEMRIDSQMNNDQRVAHESVNVLISSAGNLPIVQRQLRAHWQGAMQRASQHAGIDQHLNYWSRLRNRWFELVNSPALIHRVDDGATIAHPIDACGSLGRRWWRRLCEMYGGRMRFYHTLDHLHNMLQHFDAHIRQLQRPELVVLAIFFHDAVYDVHRSDNELKSAELLREFCVDAEACGAGAIHNDDIETVANWIERTASHHTADGPTRGDLAFFLDFDLAILGASHAQYSQYAERIRLEYHHVPWRDFKKRRIAVLTRFTDVQLLFFSDSFRATHEAAARTNIACELDCLRGARGAESRSQL